MPLQTAALAPDRASPTSAATASTSAASVPQGLVSPPTPPAYPTCIACIVQQAYCLDPNGTYICSPCPADNTAATGNQRCYIVQRVSATSSSASSCKDDDQGSGPSGLGPVGLKCAPSAGPGLVGAVPLPCSGPVAIACPSGSADVGLNPYADVFQSQVLYHTVRHAAPTTSQQGGEYGVAPFHGACMMGVQPCGAQLSKQ